MIAALIAAGVCLSPPLYDMTGPVCTPTSQEIECQCSECAIWNPVDGADWYDLHRVDQDGTIHEVIGSSRVQPGYYDDDDVWHPKVVENIYCFAMDSSSPNDGRRYVYTVRACAASWTPTCSAWSAQSVSYIGAPLTCYDDGKKIACPQIY